MQGKYTVAEVVGDVAASGFAQHIKTSCGKKGKEVKIIERPLESLSGDDRDQSLSTNGKRLDLVDFDKKKLRED